MTSSLMVLDTNIVIDFLQDKLPQAIWESTIQGHIPTATAVTIFELRRRVKPGSHLEKNWANLLPPSTVIADDLQYEDWVLAADLIRRHFWGKRKDINQARLQNDALNCAIAHRLQCGLWSRDADFPILCSGLSLRLYTH
jgi:predicted nucleic acid-binding protein